jgi:Plexin cytoplasmic RasGAP domain
MVSQFYADIARLPQISDQEMGTSMQQLSIQQNDEFDTIAALKELYIYVTTYKEQVSIRDLSSECVCPQVFPFSFLDHRRSRDGRKLQEASLSQQARECWNHVRGRRLLTNK